MANVFENFRNTCVRIYELDSSKCLSAPGLVWQAASKKTEVKLELLTDVDMLLMVKKGIRGEICHVIYKYAEANSKYMKDYDTMIQIRSPHYWDVTIWMGNVSNSSRK